MTQGKYVELSVAQRTEVWRRWKAGESLHSIGHAFNRPQTSIHCLLAHLTVGLFRQSAGVHSSARITARSGRGDFSKSFAIRKKVVDVTAIEPVTPCLQSPTIASNNSFRFL